MEASFVDLRKKSAEIIKALSRKERVTVLYRGKPAAVMTPVGMSPDQRVTSAEEHAAFGLWADRLGDAASVAEHMSNVRRRRYDDL